MPGNEFVACEILVVEDAMKHQDDNRAFRIETPSRPRGRTHRVQRDHPAVFQNPPELLHSVSVAATGAGAADLSKRRF